MHIGVCIYYKVKMKKYKEATLKEAVEKLRKLRKKGYNLAFKGKGDKYVRFTTVHKKKR